MVPFLGAPGKFVRYDLAAAGVLPDGWQESLFDVALRHARKATLDSAADSSLEPEGTLIEYGLVDGDEVSRRLPWLDQLYRNELLALARKLHGPDIVPSSDRRNGVNVNVLQGWGSRYEWHVDTNPLTGLLFVTSHAEEDGGQLVFKGEYDQISCVPVAGHLLLFDARRSPHRVTPLRIDGIRVSVPMNFFTAEALAARSPELDKYLYS